jgi:tRNA A37 threonylcarbamoyladenosine synthetase subunit TsaC/SUA5/YrdC
LIAEQLDHAVDAAIDSGECGTEPATVIDFSQPEPEIVIKVAWVRPEPMGAGDGPRKSGEIIPLDS